MIEVTVKVGLIEYVFEFNEEPTEQDIQNAMDTIGGRPKRK